MPDVVNPALGLGLLCTYCTVVLPDALGNLSAVTTVQPTFGVGTAANVRGALPSAASGRQLLTGAIVCRLSCTTGQLPDTQIPTTTGLYGIDLSDTVAADMTAADLGQFAASIDAQIRQDERCIQSRSTCVLAGDLMIITINLVDSTGPFKLTVSVDTLSKNLQLLSA